MTDAAATHLKLFTDQGIHQAALFSGPDEQQHWLRNVQVDEILLGGWQQLPHECLISIEEVEAQGFLRRSTSGSKSLTDASAIIAWSTRAAGLAARQADNAAATGDQDTAAGCCRRVVAALETGLQQADQATDRQAMVTRRTAWLSRAIDLRLELWNATQSPQHAEDLAVLFASLADNRWHDGTSDPSAAETNRAFWHNQALRAWARASESAEQRGDLKQAEWCSQRVVTLLTQQEPSD